MVSLGRRERIAIWVRGHQDGFDGELFTGANYSARYLTSICNQ
jgi:hypothetical protein